MTWRVRLISNIRNQRFVKRHIEWILWALVYIGSKPMIVREFKEKFKMSISKEKIQDILDDEKNQHKLEDIRAKHDKDLHKEYLASKRAQLKEYTLLFEKAKEDAKWRDASAILKNICDLMEPKSSFGDINFLQLEQNNNYVSMPLEEIEKEKLKLLEKYSHVIKKNKDKPQIIEHKGDTDA